MALKKKTVTSERTPGHSGCALDGKCLLKTDYVQTILNSVRGEDVQGV